MDSVTTKSMPLVAIVTPVYNGGAFLEAAMESVQAQNYPNLVHIVLDNASTDNTSDVIKRFLGRRVPVKEARNQAVLSIQQNWNAALNLIPKEAKYFHILPADDTIAPDFTRLTINLFERHPNVGVVGTLFHVNEEPTGLDTWPSERDVYSGKEAILRTIKHLSRPPSFTAVYRCSELELCKPFFNSFLFSNDLDATMRILTRSDLGMVHSDLARMNKSENTVTNKEICYMQRDYYEWLYLLRQYGPLVLSRRDFNRTYRHEQREYFRILLKWRLGWSRKHYNAHIAGLKSLGMKGPTFGEIINTMLFWAFIYTRRKLKVAISLITRHC